MNKLFDITNNQIQQIHVLPNLAATIGIWTMAIAYGTTDIERASERASACVCVRESERERKREKERKRDRECVCNRDFEDSLKERERETAREPERQS